MNDHLRHALSPTLSRERHHHIIKVLIAGEGVDQSEIQKFALNSILSHV
mgnify:CR=1